MDRAIGELVAHGYREDELWEMTPAQINVRLDLAERRKRRDMAEALSLHALAAQGDGRAIEDHIKALSK